MSFFRHFAFSSFFNTDVIDNHFLDEQTDDILSAIDQEYRFKEVNDLKYPDREIKTNILYAATTFWTYVINASNALYKKIQILEADYSMVKSKLDNKLHYELVDYEHKQIDLEDEIETVNEELKEYNSERKKIEKEYFAAQGTKKVKGSLNRIPGWVFLIVMIIAGLAELFMYKNVFMSQEIGFIADMSEETKYRYELMALGMATGFTAMLIWLAHKMGEILRHLDSAHEGEKRSYVIKLVFIALVTISAIMATVKIRGDMHHILAIDQQIDQIQETREDSQNSLFSDDEEGLDSGEGAESDADGFGSDGGDEDDTGGFGSDSDDNEGFGSEGGFDEAQSSDDSTAEKSATASGATLTSQSHEQTLRDQEIEAKGNTAFLFVIINVFIVVGGVFLSYETHTSSKIYETIEKKIKALEKQKKRLEKEHAVLERTMEKLKERTIDKLFNELLYRAALYDKEVRTYNAYLQIFELKMQLVEDYLKNLYEAKGISYNDISYKEVISDKINLDARHELQHVNDIESYLIYKIQGDDNV